MARLGLDSDAIANQRYAVVAKAVKEIEQDIRALSSEEKLQLLRTLLAELDAPPGRERGEGLAGNLAT